MAAGHFPVARRYIVYREARAQRRQGLRLRIRNADGSTSVLEATVLRSIMLDAARDLGPEVDADAVYQETIAAVYDGISRAELAKASILAARSRMERAPEYTYLAARLLLGEVYAEAIGRTCNKTGDDADYTSREFSRYLERGIMAGRLNPELRTFDLPKAGPRHRRGRDEAFAFMGVQTLYDRYLIHVDGTRIELPQWFWMRVAMGLALAEPLRLSIRTRH